MYICVALLVMSVWPMTSKEHCPIGAYISESCSTGSDLIVRVLDRKTASSQWTRHIKPNNIILCTISRKYYDNTDIHIIHNIIIEY